MKKIILIFVAFTTAVVFSACGSKNDPKNFYPDKIDWTLQSDDLSNDGNISENNVHKEYDFGEYRGYKANIVYGFDSQGLSMIKIEYSPDSEDQAVEVYNDLVSQFVDENGKGEVIGASVFWVMNGGDVSVQNNYSDKGVVAIIYAEPNEQ